MSSTKELFSTSLRKAAQDTNVNLNNQVTSDLRQISQNFNEIKGGKGNKTPCPKGHAFKRVKSSDGMIKFKCIRNSKSENTEATSTGSSGSYSQPLFSNQRKKMETKEATTTASTGSYETPAMWAKSMNKKHWGPSRKTQIPGGKFVSVKKSCKTFPYCNQGDINAIKLRNSKNLKEAMKFVSKKYNMSYVIVESIVMEKLLS